MEDEEVGIVFLTVAGRCFAVEVGQVEALRRKETLYPARDGPPDLQGFLPLGQQAIPVLDLGIRLGLREAGEQRIGFMIVAAPELAPLAFQVDRVEGPTAVPLAAVSLLPELLQTLQSRPIVWGMVRKGPELVPILDLGQIVPQEEAIKLKESSPRH